MVVVVIVNHCKIIIKNMLNNSIVYGIIVF